MNALAIEQDISGLKQECKEKDATIRELSQFLQSSEAAGSKVYHPTLFFFMVLALNLNNHSRSRHV